jgi:hypothetical protein
VCKCAAILGVPREIVPFPSLPSGSAKWMMKHMVGCLSSLAAIKGIGNLDNAMKAFTDTVNDDIDPIEFRSRIECKSIKLGKVPPSEDQVPPNGEET